MPRLSDILLCVPFLAACARGDAPVAPQEQPHAFLSQASAGMVTRPWKGRCTGVAAYIDAITLHIEGTCNIAHLGLATVETTETVVPRQDGLSDLNSVNTYTAANGDKLYTRGAGIATLKPDFSGVTFSGTETVVGGTGRFSHASGSATRIGSTRFSDFNGSYEHVGTLTYDAAHRR